MFRGLGLLKVKPLKGLGFRPMAQHRLFRENHLRGLGFSAERAFYGKPFKGLGVFGRTHRLFRENHLRGLGFSAESIGFFGNSAESIGFFGKTISGAWDFRPKP